MSLPTSRNTNYAAGVPIKSADLNDMQDGIVDHETRVGALEGNVSDIKTRVEDDVTIHLPASAMIPKSGFGISANGGRYTASGAAEGEVPLPLPLGATLRSAKAIVQGDTGGGGQTATLWVRKSDTANSPTDASLGSDTSTSSGSSQVLEVTDIDAVVTATSEIVINGYFMRITATGANVEVLGFSYTYTPPPVTTPTP